MIAFFDASALIVVLEGREPWVHGVRQALAELVASDPGMATAVSRLSWLECRVGPLRRRDPATLATFDAFFCRTDLIWVELTAAVVELATDLRGQHSLRTPDALQAACCLQLGDEAVMITGDASFRQVPGLRVVVVS
ncbi:type II toxin-antitoxin system VapC family toxin [Cyanobium sp. N5-Cardenillas]|uniref:type II toxin-antitoxin system VapC family toxin n=1 Tax=Cyanobium sp. N5-Cardenillas TaxID=2823720 RepID=UPI0020CDC13B|nr:PIN domain-containing protein [Cyanobium sp. N5-Cardenillas]MCP9785160.1 PIN domain-containing protein [Cyanobium sp. N5-Cardenillas]